MVIKLGIRDFQIISKATFYFEPGITIISGPNGSGKTAVMRAMYAAIKNPRMGKYYIKAGRKQCVVAIQIDDNNPIMWIKSKKETLYRVGEQTFHKAGSTRMSDIVANCPFVYDPLKDSKKVLNFYGEWDHPFPLDHSPGEMFKLFEDMFQIADSGQILKTIDTDKRDLKAEHVKLDLEEAGLKNKITTISDVEEAVDFERAVQLKHDLKLVQLTLKELKFDNQVAVSSEAFVDGCSGITLQEFDMGAVRDVISLKVDYEKAQNLSRISKAKKIRSQTIDVSIIPEVLSMREDLEKCEQLSLKIKMLEEIKPKTIETDVLRDFLRLKEDFMIACRTKKSGKELKDIVLVELGEQAHSIQHQIDQVASCPTCKRPF